MPPIEPARSTAQAVDGGDLDDGLARLVRPRQVDLRGDPPVAIALGVVEDLPDPPQCSTPLATPRHPPAGRGPLLRAPHTPSRPRPPTRPPGPARVFPPPGYAPPPPGRPRAPPRSAAARGRARPGR